MLNDPPTTKAIPSIDRVHVCRKWQAQHANFRSLVGVMTWSLHLLASVETWMPGPATLAADSSQSHTKLPALGPYYYRLHERRTVIEEGFG